MGVAYLVYTHQNEYPEPERGGDWLGGRKWEEGGGVDGVRVSCLWLVPAIASPGFTTLYTARDVMSLPPGRPVRYASRGANAPC